MFTASKMIIINSTGEELREIHEGDFPFPDLSNPLYISRKVAISNGKVIGGGLVRITAEGILILDKNVNIFDRAIASKYIIEALKQDCIAKKLDECHVFVKENKVQKFLKSLGFEDCKGGSPMIIHF